MASFPIIDRYKAYKAGTDYLVQWLTQSASKCSNATSFFDNLKRKAAVRGATGSEQGAISLTSQDLVRLAELVASDATAHISNSVLKVTRAVIAGREFCTNWYDVNQKTQSTSDSEGHVYFAQILKKVHDILLSAQHNFNYIGFLEFCAGIYQMLENNHHSGINKVPTSKATPHLVDSLLWEAGDAVKRCPSQAPDAIKAALAKTRFGCVMKDLSDGYEAAGRNKFSKAAFEESSGHLPKHLWPDVGPRT